MKLNIKRTISKTIRLFCILFAIFFVKSGSNKIELKVENENLNRTLDLSSMAEKVKEENANNLYAAIDTYVGDLTGYGADCPKCGGTLACTGEYVKNTGKIDHLDNEYGTVRIVAASTKYNLPCGSVVRFNLSKISEKPIIAIVLDAGVGGKSLDLLTISNESAINIGRTTLTYDVLRKGWEKKSEI